MRAAIYHGTERISVEDIPQPVAGEGELLVKVMACAICGGDLRTYRFGHRAIHPPIVLGHEIAGVVVEVGKGVTRYHQGDRVVICPGIGCGECSYCLAGNQHMCYHRQTIAHHYDGGFAEYLKVPANAVRAGNVNFIPDEVDFLNASLTEPLACVINGQEALHIQLGDTVAIIGAGPIGLLHAELARASGAGKIFLLNRSPARLERAKVFGYDAYLRTDEGDPVQEILDLTHGRGANVVIVTAGNAEAQRMGILMTGKMGKVCMFAGLPKDAPNLTFDVNFIHYRQISLYGTFSSAPRHNALALELIRSRQVNVAPILTHIVTLEDINLGLKFVQKRAGLRVAVVPHAEDLQVDMQNHPQLVFARA